MQKSEAALGRKYRLKYFDIILAVFIGTLIISNIGSTKIIGVGPFTFDGGTILFPLVYILGDIITEVYGFKMARRVIWLGFLSLLLMIITLGIIQVLPHAASSTTHEAFSTIAGVVPRIALASLVAYMIGQYVNTTLISKLKIKMKGKSYWLRSLASSSVGELIDTVIFSVIAFAGLISGSDLLNLIATVYLLKIVFELAVLPLSAYIVRRMKESEDLDVYDKGVHYSPFGDQPLNGLPK